MAKTDPRQEGYDAAARSEERRSPYDGRTENGRAWYAGYDSYEPETASTSPVPEPETSTSAGGGMTLANTPFDNSVRVKTAIGLAPADDDQDPVEEAQVDQVGLASVGASSDPDVHYLAANRRAHEMVLENPESHPDNKKSARISIQDIDAELRKMGYRA